MVDVVSFVFDLLTITGIFGILAISLNMEYGFTGLANFGKVAFFAIGAYTAGILSRFQGVPFPLDVVCGILLAGLAGFLVSIPALRLREDYLAITTIAFGEIVRLIILNEDWLTRGPMGIPGIPAPLRDVLAGREWLAFYTGLCFVVLAVVYWMCERVVNSPYGRVIKAIREDEVAAQALGKYTFKYKAQMFTLGSAIAGLAGGLYAHYRQFISPDMFVPMVTFLIWVMVILGGKGNNLGVILGAAVLEVLERGTAFIQNITTLPIEPYNLRMMIIGVLLVVLVLFRPQGLLKEKFIKTRALKVGEEKG